MPLGACRSGPQTVSGIKLAGCSCLVRARFKEPAWTQGSCSSSRRSWATWVWGPLLALPAHPCGSGHQRGLTPLAGGAPSLRGGQTNRSNCTGWPPRLGGQQASNTLCPCQVGRCHRQVAGLHCPAALRGQQSRQACLAFGTLQSCSLHAAQRSMLPILQSGAQQQLAIQVFLPRQQSSLPGRHQSSAWICCSRPLPRQAAAAGLLILQGSNCAQAPALCCLQAGALAKHTGSSNRQSLCHLSFARC